MGQISERRKGREVERMGKGNGNGGLRRQIHGFGFVFTYGCREMRLVVVMRCHSCRRGFWNCVMENGSNLWIKYLRSCFIKVSTKFINLISCIASTKRAHIPSLGDQAPSQLVLLTSSESLC
ncbi:hypothetical protein RJT34_02944 [Clitoria ternatea]|uniref:Uncharacterized protein n=1 Tax=Clitoria ternatea TaxID=43366 RepID=A0AAN9PZC7_CLITE